MGVKGLWKVVENASEEMPLEAFAVIEHQNSGSARQFVVGIDARWHIATSFKKSRGKL